MSALISQNFAFADSQYSYLMKQVLPDKMPQSFDAKNNQLLSREITWWCTGFYPGSLLYIYEQTKDEKIKAEALRALKVIEPNQTYTGNHDLGFMMFCSFGNAYRLFKDEAYKKIIFRSAESLSTRYRPTMKSIQSWNKNQYFNCPVIIDNMMNLEMLNWVSQHGGDPKFQQIAETHSNTSMKEFYRPDFSSFHVVDFDEKTGKVIRKTTHQGAANTSAWSRGQAWGLYGFITMYRDTKNEAYLTHAKNIAEFYLNHPNLPSDFVPYWDFDAGQQPLAKRDASAAAITASALMELGQFTKGAQKEKYINAAVKMLESLSNDTYRAKYGENGGFLIKHCVGALTLNSEIDVPLVYADYYFLEALKRYKDWYLK
ncbi:MAG: glucuronyl hydrolase [Chitinophagia bacterium]|nr:glucuronyl hydrolase [Chitinophagia bacterium]